MIRPIQPEDAQAIRNICEAALGHSTTAALLKQRIQELGSDDHYYLAAFEDEATHQVLGFIQAEQYTLLYGERGWNIIALAAESQAQGQGVGKQLLRSLDAHAKQSGCTFVRLNSNVTRTGAHGFYEHLGYCCDKSQKRFIKYL